MATKRATQTGLNALTHGDDVRRATHDGRVVYAAVDVVAVLANTDHPIEFWNDLKAREPALANLCEVVTFPPVDGQLPGMEDTAPTDAVDLEGLLRLVQSIPSGKAERLRRWLAQTARERLEEAENPELAVLRTRKLYEQKGYSRRWVDKRLRGVSARHELVGEWYKRGATESEQFRALTNEIVQGAFGMDVESYRRFKNLFKTGENLRDHMSDLELALTALGETVAVALHQEHDARNFEQLEADAKAAGEVVAKTRAEIECRSGRAVAQPGNHPGWWSGRRRSTPRAQAVRPANAPHPGADAEPGTETSPEQPAAGHEPSEKAVA